MTWTDHIDASTNSEAVIILGMGPQALFLLRSLQNTGKKIYLIGSKSYYAYLSRFGNKIIRTNYASIRQAVEDIREQFGSDTPVLISGGSSLDFAITNLDDAIVNIFPHPFSSLRVLNHKKKITGWLAEQKNLNYFYLPTYSWSQMSTYDGFPVLAKWDSSAQAIFKTKILSNYSNWKTFSNLYAGYAESLVFQPYISSSKFYHLGGWFQNGKLNEHVIAEEVRQNPVGMASMLHRYDGKWVSDFYLIIDEIMKHFPVTGFVQFEFIEDLKQQKLYFLECNARPWGSMDFLHFRTANESIVAVNFLKDLSNCQSDAGIFQRLMAVIKSDKLHFRWYDPLPVLAPLINYLFAND
ncbi:hypothetical protein QA596_02545 [Balneolales bacterium ANBcel1]|nr:hypothetical protein [Balneolales bacterium ANBcel1]